MIFYEKGIEITEPKKIKQHILYYKKQELLGYLMFINNNSHILPPEYWEILNERRDSTLRELCMNNNKKLDLFSPHRHEGKIKRLSKW